ncbi:MAG: ABC transporter permease [Gemmatimonadaceae bacterium]
MSRTIVSLLASIAVLDVRYAVRFLRRSPMFVAASVFSIALGIGANATVFSLVDSLFFQQPRGVLRAGFLRRVYLRADSAGQPPVIGGTLAWGDVEAIQDRARDGFVAVTGYEGPREVRMNDALSGPTVRRTAVASNYFTTLGVQPVVGRLFTPNEERDDAPVVAGVLSWNFWRAQFGGSRAVLGEKIRLDGYPVTIVGVASPDFTGLELDATDIWVPVGPVAMARDGADWRTIDYRASVNGIVRLRAGVALPLAAELAGRALAQRARGRRRGWRSSVEFVPLLRSTGPAPTTPASTLPDVSLATRAAIAALLVLAAGAANLINLWMARLLARRGEIAIRVSLGASRLRIVSHLATEALLLACLGGVVAIWIAVVFGRFLRNAVLPNVAWASGPLDAHVLEIALITTALYVFVGAVLPGWRLAVRAPGDALKRSAGRRAVAEPGMRDVVLGTQVALSVAAILGAATFAHSTLRARDYDVGFDDAHSLFVTMQFRPFPNPTTWNRLTGEASEIARHLAGVQAAGPAADVPYLSVSMDDTLHTDDDRDAVAGIQPFGLAMSAEAMRALGVRLLRGRLLAPSDNDASPRVVLLSKSLAQTLWPRTDPIGRCLRIGADSSPCREVVGITSDIVVTHLVDGRQPSFFVPIEQSSNAGATFLLIRATDPVRAAPTIRAALSAWRPDMTSLIVRPIHDLVAEDSRPWRLGASVLSVFGMITLVLAMIGVYGIVSFSVERRRRELAIRGALGAQRSDLAGVIVFGLVAPILVGILAGTLGALLVLRGVGALLFHTSAYDVGSIAAAGAMLLAAAASAAALPVWRAVRTPPGAALRAD